VFTNLASGAIAGCLAGSITYPTDLIRRRLQIQVKYKPETFSLLFHRFSKTAQNVAI